MSERFYVNLPLSPGTVLLDGAEAHHLATVCRLRPGDAVCLFNGDGAEYPARVADVHRREITLEILGVESPCRERERALHVAAPMPKGDRGQFLVEKLTELGVTAFVPLICEHSANYPRDAKREKLERYVIEASKQCGRNTLMAIVEPMAWAEYVRGCEDASPRFFAHPYDSTPIAGFASLCRAADSIRIAVGPEGGFSDAEVALAIAAGWRAISLGTRILRVETAAIALVAQIDVLAGEQSS